MSQSIKHNAKLLQTHYINILRHKYTLYILQKVTELAKIKHTKIPFSTFFNMHKCVGEIKYCSEFYIINNHLHRLVNRV